ncbi:MAG: hypothetical protein ACTHKL_15305 [Streptosporangiaceae bacterium]
MTGTSGGQRAGTNGGQAGPSSAHVPPDQLRRLVREVLAEVIGTMPAQTALPPAPPSTVPHADTVSGGTSAQSSSQLAPALPGHAKDGQGGAGDRGDNDVWTVRISTDEDLHAFALRVLKLAGNPKLRGDLISGRARFRLAATSTAASAVTHEVEKGAVTERAVAAAAAAGARLLLGPRAVLTPLAKDKARALGVPSERAPGNPDKER